MMSTNQFHIKIVTGTANPSLAKQIAENSLIDVHLDDVKRFADGEVSIHLQDDMRGRDVYIIQPTCRPVNDNYMELLLLIHTLRLASAERITVVMPYYGYARQDRKIKSRVPISASAVAKLIEAMKPHRVVTVDLHCGQIQGFFHNIPVDNLSAQNEFVWHLQAKFGKEKVKECVIVSPDAGGVSRAKNVADALGCQDLVTIMKRRGQNGQIDSMQVVGDVRGRDCIIIDDIIDTAGTLTKAAELLIVQGGANTVGACATHGVFSDPALERISASKLSFVCVTDSIPQHVNLKQCGGNKLEVIHLAPLLAEAIRRLHKGQSLSALFSTKEKHY